MEETADIVIELEPASAPPSGWLVDADGTRLPFAGLLELLALLTAVHERLRRREAPLE